VVVIGDAIGDFVDHAKASSAQQICLPQGEDRPTQRRLVGCELSRDQRQPVALVQKAGDLHLAVDHALAPHFGRMCGQYRHDHGIGEEGQQARGRDAGRARPGKRMGHRAFARCRGAQDMGTGATDVVLVLSNIGEMRKKAEGANDLKRLGRRQDVQCRFEITPRRNILVAAKADRVLANMLDAVKDSRAALLAHRVAENAAEQANIVAQRQVFVFGLDCLRFRHGLPFSARGRMVTCHTAEISGTEAIQEVPTALANRLPFQILRPAS